MYYGFDVYYVILVIPALCLAMWAQSRVKSTFARYSKVNNCHGLTGREAARQILDRNGLQTVKIEHISGMMTDHYDPRDNVVRLSDEVFNNTSVAAVGVAAHEVGHAIQHATGYFPIKVRMAIIPVTNIGSKLSIPLVLLGLVMGWPPLTNLGILLFATVAVFQLVTLPVEYNASNRALATLQGTNMLLPEEMDGARKVLGAAALTYVAALVVALANLLRLVLQVRRRRD